MSQASYRIFDMHTHAFPDAIAKRAVAVTAAKADIPAYHDGSIDGLLEYENPAQGFLLLPIATNPASVRGVNDWAAAQVGGKIRAFGSIHPDMADPEAELDHIVSIGLPGIKLHPEYQNFFVDAERLFPVYRAVFDRGLIVSFHAGTDLGYPPPVRGDAARIAAVAEAFPHGRIIAAHMGGFLQYDTVCQTLAGRENVWLDTSYYARVMEPDKMLHLSRLHGVKRILFGSDAPWTPFDESRGALIDAGFTEDELRDIFYDNAARLLGLT